MLSSHSQFCRNSVAINPPLSPALPACVLCLLSNSCVPSKTLSLRKSISESPQPPLCQEGGLSLWCPGADGCQGRDASPDTSEWCLANPKGLGKGQNLPLPQWGQCQPHNGHTPPTNTAQSTSALRQWAAAIGLKIIPERVLRCPVLPGGMAVSPEFTGHCQPAWCVFGAPQFSTPGLGKGAWIRKMQLCSAGLGAQRAQTDTRNTDRQTQTGTDTQKHTHRHTHR